MVSGIDLLVVRELTGGIYFGKPAGRDFLVYDYGSTTDELKRLST